MEMITHIKTHVILLLFLCSSLYAAPVPDLKGDRNEMAGLLVGVSLSNIGVSEKKEEPTRFVKKKHNKGRDARRRRVVVPTKPAV